MTWPEAFAIWGCMLLSYFIGLKHGTDENSRRYLKLAQKAGEHGHLDLVTLTVVGGQQPVIDNLVASFKAYNGATAARAGKNEGEAQG